MFNSAEELVLDFLVDSGEGSAHSEKGIGGERGAECEGCIQLLCEGVNLFVPVGMERGKVLLNGGFGYAFVRIPSKLGVRFGG